jgi:N-acetylglucosaminyldiphosphoundecaprenol N-acetyl-beta-D-mannosaminyltransferase
MAVEAVVSTVAPSTQALPARMPRVAAAPLDRPRVELGGILLDQVDLKSAVARISHLARSGQPHQVVTVNLDFLSIAGRDDTFRSTLNRADLAVADGMPLVWLARFKGQPLPERVAGVDLVIESCRLAAEAGQSVFLLGAGPGVARAAAKRLQEMFPGLRIAGTYSPPVGQFTEEEHTSILATIRDAAPDFLFVALGAPRQDLWIRENQPRLKVPVAMGVGCVFDLLAGSVQRAPLWMQHYGLEWSFRLIQEPRRLWRRYLVNDLPLLARLALGSPRADSDDALPALP